VAQLGNLALQHLTMISSKGIWPFIYQSLKWLHIMLPNRKS
jgi:hypothetical protein